MSKIGVFAGTFDPIHNGHIAFAKKALENGLEKVYFLPEQMPLNKKVVEEKGPRVAMIRYSLAGLDNLELIADNNQLVFSPRGTLSFLTDKFPGKEIVLLFGADVVPRIASWPEIELLAKNTQLMIATRNDSLEKIKALFDDIKQDINLDFKYQIIESDENDISSTRIKAEGISDKFVPQIVAKYIQERNLYS